MTSVPLDVERRQIALFCKAIGETRAIYLDREAAQAAGYRDVIAPPTFGIALEMLADGGGLYALLAEMGVDLARSVHGEQEFTYHGPICAGDTITFERQVTQLEVKKGGALELVTLRTSGINQDGSLVIALRNVAVARA